MSGSIWKSLFGMAEGGSHFARNAMGAFEPIAQDDIVWPSGTGEQFGVMRMSRDRLAAAVHEARDKTAVPFQAFWCHDELEPGLILLGLVDGPVSLAFNEQLAPGIVAIVADSDMATETLQARFKTVFGDSLSVKWHPRPALGGFATL